MDAFRRNRSNRKVLTKTRKQNSAQKIQCKNILKDAVSALYYNL